MKKIILLNILILSISMSQATHAEDVKLKRGCLKDYPLAQGLTDAQLIGIYAQVCDKKNKDNRNAYLIQAAQRFQQLGMNERGLSLINQLESQQVRSHSLTDTKFLIGAQLANNALLQMRNQQSRTLLADTTYPAAKTLIQNIESTAPRSTKTTTSTATQPVTQAVAKRRPKPTYKKPVAKPVAKAKAAPKVAAPSSNNPFDSF